MKIIKELLEKYEWLEDIEVKSLGGRTYKYKPIVKQ